MKLSWENVCGIFEEAAIWENGHDMYWYRLMWALIEYRHMNEYKNEEERMRIYSRVFAVIRIYTDFIEECFNDDDIESDVGIFSSEIFRLVFSEEDVHEIFTILNNELGTRRTFYSMFITCIEFTDDSSEESSGYEYDESGYDDEYDCSEYDDDYEEYDDYDEYEEQEDESDEDTSAVVWEEFCEDYYETFEEYVRVLASSSMSMLNNVTPEKAAGFLYLSKNMKNEMF